MPISAPLIAAGVSTGGKAGVSLGTVASIATIGGAALSGISTVRAGQAAQAQSEFQAATLRQQAERERQIAEADEEDFRRRQSRLMATRRATLGGSGVDPAAGSPLLVSEDFAGESELQALRIRSGGDLRANRLEQSAQLQIAKGRNARTSGFTRGGALLLSGAGEAFS